MLAELESKQLNITERNISNIGVLNLFSLYCTTRDVEQVNLGKKGWLVYDEDNDKFYTVKHNRVFDLNPVKKNQPCEIRPMIEFDLPLDKTLCGQSIELLGRKWEFVEGKNNLVALCNEIIGKESPNRLHMFLAEWYKKVAKEQYFDNNKSIAEEVLKEIENTEKNKNIEISTEIEDIHIIPIKEYSKNDELDVAI